MVQSTLTSKATKLNFFIHNLAQRKGSAAHSGSCLSFCPQDGSIQEDKRIRRVEVIAFEKRYDHEQNKFYVYVVEVERFDGESALVFRRFSEFNELNQKLAAFKVRLPVFPGKKFLSRSHIREVSEKRQAALDKWVSRRCRQGSQ